MKKYIVFLSLILALSLYGLVSSFLREPLSIGDIRVREGVIKSVKCEVSNNAKHVYLLVKYKEEEKPVVEGMPHNLSSQCGKLSPHRNSPITLTKVRNYTVGVIIDDQEFLSINQGIKESNEIGGMIFLFVVTALSSAFSLLRLLMGHRKQVVIK